MISNKKGLPVVLVGILFASLFASVNAFSSLKMGMSKEIYGVKNSGWNSPQWNWGYAVGTGHDCAAICRQQYSTRESRKELVNNLLEPNDNPELREPKNFEEVRLVLGLAWQRGRWDGSDGGQGGYGEVLARMADAKRYEDGTEEECCLRFIEDMHDRFEILADNTSMELREMRSLLDNASDDIDYAKRKCSGLVLDAMGFVDKGL